MHSPPTGWPCCQTILHPAARNLRSSCNRCQSLASVLALLIIGALLFGPMAIATERRQFAVVDPADGSVVDTLESAQPEDGVAAVDAAEAAAADWAGRAPRER